MCKCKVCYNKIKSQDIIGRLGYCKNCDEFVEWIDDSYKIDYDLETGIFSLVDEVEGIVIVITKPQLEALIRFYNRERSKG